MGHKQRTTMIDKETLEKEPDFKPLDEADIALLKTYGLGPYTRKIKSTENDIQKILKNINNITEIKESDTGLSAQIYWNLPADKQRQQEEQPLQVARCTKIINPNTDDAKYVINIKQ